MEPQCALQHVAPAGGTTDTTLVAPATCVGSDVSQTSPRRSPNLSQTAPGRLPDAFQTPPSRLPAASQTSPSRPRRFHQRVAGFFVEAAAVIEDARRMRDEYRRNHRGMIE